VRRYIGSLVLAALSLISLWFLLHRGEDRGSHTAQPSAAVASVTSSPAQSLASLTPPPPPPSTLPPSTSTSGTSSTLSPVEPVEPEGTPVNPAAPATPASPAQAAQWSHAVARATSFMRAFARPPSSVDAATWWAGVKPYFSEQAAQDYADTDPSNVPFTTVTGPAAVVPTGAPDFLVIAVRVPTNVGDYLVELRTTDTGQWVTRATPPTIR